MNGKVDIKINKELAETIYAYENNQIKKIDEDKNENAPMYFNDFKNMLVYLVDREGNIYARFRNDYTRYHVDAFNTIYNNDIKKWYQRELKTRDLRIHFEVFKDYVIILSCGWSDYAGATVIIPKDITNEQIEKLEKFKGILKKCDVRVHENGKENYQEKGEEFVFESKKQYIKK